MIGGDVDLVDHEEKTEVAWCTLDKVYEHFEELAQIPSGMYPPLFEYLDRVLVMRILRSDQGKEMRLVSHVADLVRPLAPVVAVQPAVSPCLFRT